MEKNNFLHLPAGLRDTRNRAFFAEDSGFYSYESPLLCLYHLFDIVAALKANFTDVNAWVINQLLISRPFTQAWNESSQREKMIYKYLGNKMFELDEKHIYDIVCALSAGSPQEYSLTRGEVAEEWRLYQSRCGEL